MSCGNRYHPAVRKVKCSVMPDVIPLTDTDETFIVTTPTVGCDGGGGALGHPLVYLAIERDGEVICPYCSRRYVLAEGAQPAHGH